MNKINIMKPEVSLKKKSGEEGSTNPENLVNSSLNVNKDSKMTEVVLEKPIKNENSVKDFSDILDLELTQSAFGV